MYWYVLYLYTPYMLQHLSYTSQWFTARSTSQDSAKLYLPISLFVAPIYESIYLGPGALRPSVWAQVVRPKHLGTLGPGSGPCGPIFMVIIYIYIYIFLYVHVYSYMGTHLFRPAPIRFIDLGPGPLGPFIWARAHGAHRPMLLISM